MASKLTSSIAPSSSPASSNTAPTATTATTATTAPAVASSSSPKRQSRSASVTGSGSVSRSTTPAPPNYSFDKPANDHTISFRHRLSQKEYPPDCPPLNVRWYYAVDVPKTVTGSITQPQTQTTNTIPTFSSSSNSISTAANSAAATTTTTTTANTTSTTTAAAAAFASSAANATATTSPPAKVPQKYIPFGRNDSNAIEAAYLKLAEDEVAGETAKLAADSNAMQAEGDIGLQPEIYQGKKRQSKEASTAEDERFKIPVNEDYLFDVDLKKRELAPVYWRGPSYDIRRGTWFFQEGSTLRPCDENLATQLEEGYLKIKPFRKDKDADRPTSSSSKSASSDGTAPATTEASIPAPKPAPAQHPTWRLFGSHINSFVVFADPTTAWLMTDDFYGKLSSTLYQRITSGQHMGGIKLVRGHSEGTKAAEKASKLDATSVSRPVTPTPESKLLKAESNKSYKRKSMPAISVSYEASNEPQTAKAEHESRKGALERKLSALEPENEAREEQKMMEDEMKEDYKNPDEGDAEDQGREIEHLLLTTHGIGQRLSERLASVNFVHDVNTFRKTLKSVYSYSPDLQALNNELDSNKKNCRVQCLPVCWRHLVDFPQQSLRHNRSTREQDLGSRDNYNEPIDEEYPSLADITVQGVPAVRSLITDLALDILLYQSPAYREHIARTVLEECNRIYRLFKKRNPGFRGKVSLLGHSLGSAILFDLASRQPMPGTSRTGLTDGEPLVFDFPIENLVCLGSPVGLFQMLQGHTISARSHIPHTPNQALDISSPACTQLYNIFHPTDPISYRIEPLVSRDMAELKPQPLPYTKRGLWTTGTAQLAGGISGVGMAVSKSVSGLWSSLSTGIASSILNRSLGFVDGDGSAAAAAAGPSSAASSRPGLGDRKRSPPTNEAGLIDTEIETLYEGFQKSRTEKEREEDGENAAADDEEEARRIRLEDLKVRALNATGRIDFAIQEGVFDVSLISSLASHLGYWTDEDVAHFLIAQMLGATGAAAAALGMAKGKGEKK